MQFNHYSMMADLFAYPNSSFLEKVQQSAIFLKKSHPSAADEVDLFYEGLPKGNPDQLQEIFTRTFDIQAITTLDVGYVLFGDDYKRGQILSNLNREHKNANNDCGLELADHLPNLLRLIPKLDDIELIQDLVSEILAPALQIMVHEFDPGRWVKKNKLYQKKYKTLIEMSVNHSDVYYHALKALLLVLKQDFQINEEIVPSHLKNDFINALSAETRAGMLEKK
ncbi:MAG: hypothetical protein Q8Q33_07625 [Chlamydiota bacterium]|nr:hypothetical protein [Chlamydiota bacterium]